jgi:hypothetical protein
MFFRYERSLYSIALDGGKLNDLSCPTKNLNWFWGLIHASGLYPFLQMGFHNLSHAMLTALSERWHEESSGFHFPVVEMIVTLNDVTCLLNFLVEGGMLSHDKKVTQDK